MHSKLRIPGSMDKIKVRAGIRHVIVSRKNFPLSLSSIIELNNLHENLWCDCISWRARIHIANSDNVVKKHDDAETFAYPHHILSYHISDISTFIMLHGLLHDYSHQSFMNTCAAIKQLQ